jgi:hypothetical protein
MIGRDELKALLHYDRESGVFRWRTTRKYGLILPWSVAGWNDGGYVRIQIGVRSYLAHRLAWLYEFGEWPSMDVDHINGNPRDNRISNLRNVRRQMNAQNRRPESRVAATGMVGVGLHRDGRFVAGIYVSGKRRHLGIFATAKDAQAAYLNAKREMHEGCTV